MKIQIILCVLISVLICVHALYSLDNKCIRPEGDEGVCVRYDQCPQILEHLEKKTKSNTELAKYGCGFEFHGLKPKPKVCCDFYCYTPEGNLGTCKNVSLCAHLNEALTGDKKARSYVRESRCLTGSRDVCCGPPPSADYITSKDDCASRTYTFPPHSDSFCCGLDANAASKIIGGEGTAIDQYPWLAVLDYQRTDTGEITSYCGGALISSRYVVTAAHCINVPGAGAPKSVRLGVYNINKDVDYVGSDRTDPVHSVGIEDIIPHPQYDTVTQGNDIALIRLASPVPFTDFIRPICLPNSNVLNSEIDHLEVYVAGWGRVNDTHSRSDVKQHVKLPLVNTQTCQAAFKSRQLSGKQICAGGQGKDSCKGDSGGPLMLKTGLLYELIGVVSIGYKDCGTIGKPGLYTNVHPYTMWIRRNIRP